MIDLIKKLGKNKVQLNIVLAPYTTFKIGGKADFFYVAQNENELVKAVNTARNLKIPFLILGQGSNILISDFGFRGLIIKNESDQIKISDLLLEAESGVALTRLLTACQTKNLSGLEICAGIPGTLGGALWGNAGTKQGIGQLVESVKVLKNDGSTTIVPQSQCGFAYRHSSFKKTDEIILSAVLKLEKANSQTIKKRLSDNLNLRSNQPKIPSAGSVFKNPPGDFAGRLIEECGLKGQTSGQAQISPLHANFIVNLGGTTAQDVLTLTEQIKKNVKDKFGIALEEEIIKVGDF